MQINSLDDISSDYRHIYLSPHLDDAVYSCGGTIGLQARAGQRVLVVTVFAGIPSARMRSSLFATRFHTYMGFDQFASRVLKYRGVGRRALKMRELLGLNPNTGAVITARRDEDASVLTYLQADYLWLDYLEAIYRGTPAYYSQQSQLVGGEVNPADRWIDKRLAQDLITLHKRLPDAVWYAPLGVGCHLDHQIVFFAVEQLVMSGACVKFYEDFPYVTKESSLEQRLKAAGWTLEADLIDISETLHMRQRAAEMYGSQVKMNFENIARTYSSQMKISLDSRKALYKIIHDYTRSIHPDKTVHVERYWSVSQTGKGVRE